MAAPDFGATNERACGCSAGQHSPASGFYVGRKGSVRMVSEYSIVRQDRFIEATRDSGYKGTESALSELVDNAIQAQANSVMVQFLAEDVENDGPGRPKQPRVLEVLIA